MSYVLPLVWLLAVLQSVQSDCNLSTLQTCQTQFNNLAGVQGDWTNPTALYSSVQTMLLRSTDTLDTLCSALPVFHQCLTTPATSYDDCLSVYFLLAQNVTLPNAYDYTGIMRSVQLRCDEGFDAVVDNQRCLSDVYSASSNSLQQCVNAFTASLADQPTFCQNLESLQTCYRVTFLNRCGVEAGWLACETLNFAYDHVNQCHLKCVSSLTSRQHRPTSFMSAASLLAE